MNKEKFNLMLLKMKYLLISISFLLFFSCTHEDKTENLLYNQLVETNDLLKKNNQLISPLVEQIFYKRCKNTNNFRKEVALLLNDVDEVLKYSDILLTKENIKSEDLFKLKKNYSKSLNNFKKFTEAILEWKVNSYRVFLKDYSKYDDNFFPEIVLKMQNDLLLNKSELFDFILFYSVCQHKPSSFIIPIARDNKLNISSINKFSFELTCDIPDKKDILLKQIRNLSLTKNGVKINAKPKIDFIYSDTANIQAVIRFLDLEKGEYSVSGNYVINRLNENSKDTIQTIMPFEFLFIQ